MEVFALIPRYVGAENNKQEASVEKFINLGPFYLESEH